MSIRLPYLTTSGPPEDLENFARQRGQYANLPNPPGTIPFGVQGEPISDRQQTHTSPTEMKQVVSPSYPNPLFYGHFIGTSVLQINTQPFQSVNEQLVWD